MIPAEAVEAAAKKLYQASGLTVWDKEDESTRNFYRRNAKSALEAAAPHMSTPPLRITQALLDAQRAKGWADWHPEDYCHRCYESNVSWHVDAQPWADVMRGGSHEGWGRWQEIICIPCFTSLADIHYGARQAWKITRDRSSYHLELANKETP